MMLEVKNLSFSYKRQKVLENISFASDKNQIISILGPNGAGKTTLLKCINRILKYKTGSVFIGGKSIDDFDQKKIAQNISYVPQRAEVSRLTVFDAVLLGRIPHIKFRSSEKDLKMVYSVIKKIKLESLSLRYLDELSSGELQKVFIARALSQDTKMIIMDEPTSSLDLKNQIEILKLIKDISRSHELAVVMTLHDINTALRYSDRILFLKKGRILYQCIPSEVTPEIIEDVYDVKVNIHEFKEFNHIIPL